MSSRSRRFLALRRVAVGATLVLAGAQDPVGRVLADPDAPVGLYTLDVVDVSTGAALPAAEVRWGPATAVQISGSARYAHVRPFDSTSWTSVEADTRGRATFSQAHGSVELAIEVRRAGYLTLQMPLEPTVRHQGTAGLVRAADVTGRLVDGEDEPLDLAALGALELRADLWLPGPEVAIPLLRARALPSPEVRVTPLDEDGSFHLEELPPWIQVATLTIVDELGRTIAGPRPLAPLAPGEEREVVWMPRFRSELEVVVLDAEGQPVVGREVDARTTYPKVSPWEPSTWYHEPPWSEAREAVGRTGADGRVVLRDLPPGELDVGWTEATDDAGPAPCHRRRVLARDGETLVLRDPSRRVVTGAVEWPPGFAETHARARVSWDGGSQSVELDRTRAFSLRGVPVTPGGAWVSAVSVDGRAFAARPTLAPANEPVIARLTPVNPIEVTARTAEPTLWLGLAVARGSPLVRFHRESAHHTSERRELVTSLDLGEFDHVLVVSAGVSSACIVDDLRPGRDVRELDLRPTGVLRIEHGPAIDVVPYRLRRRDIVLAETAAPPHQPDLVALPPGPITVEWTDAAGRLRSRTVVVESDGEAVVELTR